MFTNYVLLAILAYIGNAEVQFEFVNRESEPIWVGIQGNKKHPHLNDGGVALDQGQTVTVSAPGNWSGRFWPRTWCDAATKHCQTGDCGNRLHCQGTGGQPPTTLIEITLKEWKDEDYYHVSLLDGFNLRASIEPINGTGPQDYYSCTRASCLADINSSCPEELKVVYNGRTIACNSACNKFNTDQYCCRGADYGNPEICESSNWPINYPVFFKNRCPDAYSYIYDGVMSTFTCKALHYRIQFGATRDGYVIVCSYLTINQQIVLFNNIKFFLKQAST